VRRSNLAAVREEEDSEFVMYGSSAGFFIVRKADKKVLALPWTRETHALHRKVRSARHRFIADALADFTSNTKWRSARSMRVKLPVREGELHAR
jgi:hypothetical protein